MSKNKFPITVIFDEIEWIKGEVNHYYGYKKKEIPKDAIHFSHGSVAIRENDPELNVWFTTNDGGRIEVPILNFIKEETNRKRITQKLIDKLENLFDGVTFETYCFDNGRDEIDLDYLNYTDLKKQVEEKIIYWIYKGYLKVKK